MDYLKIILTSTASVIVLFIITKIMGHKQISQLNSFDYITGITIGSIAAEFATELEQPLKPLVATLVYGFIAFLISIVTDKFARTRKYINGTPTIIMNNGVIYRKNMKKAKLDLSEFMMLCRQKGFFNMSDIQTAVFEYNGMVTILPYSNKRPSTPFDMNLSPQADNIMTEVIMDGRILDGNLKRLGLNSVWLNKQLKEQGYKSAHEVYLGLCDAQNMLSLYPPG